MTPVLAVQDIHKSYGPVRALAGVDFEVRPGHVTGLVGENGAGKSTLMRILAGQEAADGGTILIDGRVSRFAGVHAARSAGIVMVSQELALFPDLTVLENLCSWQPTHRSAIAARARLAADDVGLRAPLRAPLSSLRIGERQLVEIARALLEESRVLILDEPNSALNASESEVLFSVVNRLRARGVAIVYISHRLEEVFRVCDEVVVLRNGSVVRTSPVEHTSVREVIRDMIGREPTRIREPRAAAPPVAGPAARLEVTSLAAGPDLVDLSFAAHPGEVVGVAGLDDSGVTTLFDVLFGQTSAIRGEVRLPGSERKPRSIRDAVRLGVARVPSDRHRLGLALSQSVADNLAHVTAGALGRDGWWLSRRRLLARAQARARQLGVDGRQVEGPAGDLSGGNQQKVALGKWLEAEPRVVLLDDPTRGVDVGAKVEIYAIIGSLAAAGRIVLFRSSELLEYAMVCDRVLVLYGGRLCAELDPAAVGDRTLLETVNTGLVAA